MTRKYSAEHVWIDTSNPQAARVGITEHAQDALGDIVFINFPAVGSTIEQHAVAGEIESVKTAADLYAPASGQVVAINPEVQADPSLVNSAPLEAGWLFTLALSDTAELEQLLGEPAV